AAGGRGVADHAVDGGREAAVCRLAEPRDLREQGGGALAEPEAERREDVGPDETAREIECGDAYPGEAADPPEEHAREARAVDEAREHDLPRAAPGRQPLHEGRDPGIGGPAPHGRTAVPAEREEDRVAEQGTHATRDDRRWKADEAKVHDHTGQDER